MRAAQGTDMKLGNSEKTAVKAVFSLVSKCTAFGRIVSRTTSYGRIACHQKMEMPDVVGAALFRFGD